MSPCALFITGTDTGVGKTILTTLLVRHLCGRKVACRAVKPLCSGGRTDARALASAQQGIQTLDEINPWTFRAPLAPLVAARLEHRVVLRAAVRRFLRAQQRHCEVLLVEGAGGLLSPLGADFDARALIADLTAVPVIVCPNRLGALNQALLVLAALPRPAQLCARIVLVQPRRPDTSQRSNLELLKERVGTGRVCALPRLEHPRDPAASLRQRGVREILETILDGLV